MNVSHFKEGYIIGIIYEKILLGQNEIKLDVYKHKFHEVVMDASGEIQDIWSNRKTFKCGNQDSNCLGCVPSYFQTILLRFEVLIID